MINNTNDSIRYVAFKLFLEKGYEAANIRDICKEVNIKASSLYFYYKSKEELFFCIYDNIWIEKIKLLQDIEGLNQNNLPKVKLYNLFIGTIEHNLQDILKEKFLLRAHLYPPEELAKPIRNKYIFWSKEENKVILNIIKQCVDRKIIDDNRIPEDCVQEYKKFINSIVIDIIITSISINKNEIDNLWLKFWNCMMTNKEG